MYGSDARYTHYLGEGDYWINELNQITPVEAWAAAHLPWLFKGGIDVKAGQWVTLEGAETIDPTTNYLYSHSYIFNFGIPFVDTGVLTIWHVDPLVDIYAGVVSGVNTTFGERNVAHPGFEGGIGLNLLDGNLTILATTHFGPENPNTPIGIAACGGCDPNNTLRFLNDITATWKINDSWTLITDLNDIHDDGGVQPSGYGGAQYVVYTVNEWLKAVGRVEVWRDNKQLLRGRLSRQFRLRQRRARLPEHGDPGCRANHLFRNHRWPQHRAYASAGAALAQVDHLPAGSSLRRVLEQHDALRWPDRLRRPGLPWFRGRHQELTIHLRRRHHREVLRLAAWRPRAWRWSRLLAR